MTATERFLSYLDVDTTSDEASESSPSTPNQRAFAKRLVEEMRAMGIADARLDAWGYVYGSIPATCEGMPAIGLIAHMDTSDAVPGGPIRARIVHYEGGDIVLNEEKGIVLGARDFPSLGSEIGNDLIVTDGTTLLGCDDKAGVAEILTLAERFLMGQGPRHGKLCIAFTPDEEISRGAERFRLDELGADFGYTVDGGALGEVEYENFNAADAHVRFCGRSMHPGSAKDKMLNASTLAMEFHAMLPVRQTPENTDGYEGFFHLT
ncbi:MAG TPA: tripeptide aminopeptidase PepT, partial [Candidatus Aphodomonas merdavium]|nr:tripeptide aminopeptidase PepT [Candidatus Aphodomonas merdavium]